MGGVTPFVFNKSLQLVAFCKDLSFYLTYEPFYKWLYQNDIEETAVPFPYRD